MISPAQQQLDEALTTGGHSDNCPAFEGHRCPGHPMCDGGPVPDALYAAVGADRAAEAAKRPRVVSELRPPGPALVPASSADVVTLTGEAAVAFDRYRAAARDLKAATEIYKAAQAKYQEAHQAFADAVAAT